MPSVGGRTPPGIGTTSRATPGPGGGSGLTTVGPARSGAGPRVVALEMQRPGGRRVDRLVPVVPLDPVARRLLAHHLPDRPAPGLALGRLRLGANAVSDLECHESSLRPVPRSVLAIPARRRARGVRRMTVQPPRFRRRLFVVGARA